MQFYSPSFIILFFLFFLVYWLCARSSRSQNILLLAASLSFYASFDWRCLLLLLFVSLTAYASGMLFSKERFKRANPVERNKGRYYVSFAAISIIVLILAYFKYCNFFLSSICSIVGKPYSPIRIILPLGISFYSFSAISYIVDTYRGRVEPTKDIVVCLLYTSFFPGILSGPIHNATLQLPQYCKKREFNYEMTVQGFKDFLWGAFLKLCVADKIGIYVDKVFNGITNAQGNQLLFASVSYSLQIYADFAGYSLMAIGLAKMLGIQLQQNFKLPYFSKTITEFWSRWHMSLTGWFKNYVYIPLGGNRVSKLRWISNIMIVFLLSGLWHGANWTFVIWGGIHGVTQIIEKLIYGKRIKDVGRKFSIMNLFRMALTFLIVTLAWLIFRMPSVGDAFEVIKRIILTRGHISFDPIVYIGFMSASIMICKDLVEQTGNHIRLLNNNSKIVRYLACLALIAYILVFGKLDGGSFIYSQF